MCCSWKAQETQKYGHAYIGRNVRCLEKSKIKSSCALFRHGKDVRYSIVKQYGSHWRQSRKEGKRKSICKVFRVTFVGAVLPQVGWASWNSLGSAENYVRNDRAAWGKVPPTEILRDLSVNPSGSGVTFRRPIIFLCKSQKPIDRFSVLVFDMLTI